MSEIPEGMAALDTSPSEARPSASLMLTRDGPKGVEVLLARRVENLPAFPGYWAFPGGGISRVDRESVSLIQSLGEMPDSIEAATHAGMHRELLEEMGLCIPSAGRLEPVDSELRNKVLKDKSEWMKLVKSGDLPFAEKALIELTRRTTPEFAALRFENRFMFMHCTGDIPEPVLEDQTEFDDFRWDRPETLLEEWNEHQIKLPPPLVTILQEFVEMIPNFDDVQELAKDMARRSPEEKTILFAGGVECIPVPTATLPPATTTNSYLIGNPGGEHILVDPAIRTDEGKEKIEAALKRMEDSGGTLIAYLFTHRHIDHLGDIEMLKSLSDAEFWASHETAVALSGNINRIIMDADIIVLSHPGGAVMWNALVTPGHCPGHVCLLNDAGLVAGDMVAGIGTILIPPSEGMMEVYIEQLKRLLRIDPHLIFPSHGPVIPLPQKVINHYIEHRQARHDKVLKILQSGQMELSAIAREAYADTPQAHPMLARQQTLSHLLAWQRQGKVSSDGDNWMILGGE